MLNYLRKIKDYFLIKRCGLFDTDYYLLNYPDVRQADVDPLWHFVSVGWKEGRNPSDKFNTNHYLENHPDVRLNEQNPLKHYLLFCHKKIRPLTLADDEMLNFEVEKGPMNEKSDTEPLNINDSSLKTLTKNPKQSTALTSTDQTAKNLNLEERIITYEQRLREINVHWNALVNSTTWKTLNRLGKFREFPDLTTEIAQDKLEQKREANPNSEIAAEQEIVSDVVTRDYDLWVSRYDTLDGGKRFDIKTEITTFTYKPLISVVMPTYNTQEKWLRAAIKSVQAQLYENWELCIADDCSTDENVRKVIIEHAAKDSRVKYIFRQKNGHISAASNSALSIASGEFVALLDHDDLLAETALYRIVQALNQNLYSDVIYSDEDKIDEDGHRYDPYFKPDWMPDLFNSQNFVSHLGVYRKKVVDSVGGFQVGYEGAQDWDLMMRISEIVSSENIRHLPFILYHWRAIQGSTARAKSEKNYVEIAQEKTIQDHFKRLNTQVILKAESHGFWRVQHLLDGYYPKVSIIIPTKNHSELLKTCIKSVVEKTTYPDYEILVIDNESSEENALVYLRNLRNEKIARVVEFPHAFNYSAINNFGVDQSKGEVVVLLNNDTEIISTNWLEEMVSLAIRPTTGAVGAKLYYPNDTIQHAGVLLGVGGVAAHAYLYQPRATPGQMGRALLTQNYSAVTGACLAVEKRKFLEVGGLNDIELKVAFNDIDFCIKLLMAGYRNVWTPYVELYHHESASRGYEDTPEKKERFMSETRYMMDKWKEILKNDPAYNLNLSLETTSFELAFPPRVSRV